MISKATILIAVCLVLFGYRWGKRKAQMQDARRSDRQSAQVGAGAPAPKKELLSVRVLLVIVAILLIIAILSSLSGKIG